jgi:hypothetical protein
VSDLPPVPPEQRSDEGSGSDRKIEREDNARGRQNFDNQGRHGNIKQNTTNQGHQQDRCRIVECRTRIQTPTVSVSQGRRGRIATILNRAGACTTLRHRDRRPAGENPMFRAEAESEMSITHDDRSRS